MNIGGLSALRRDIQVLETTVTGLEASGKSGIEICKAVQSISRYLEASSASIGESVSALSFAILSRIDRELDSACAAIKANIQGSVTKPCINPVTPLLSSVDEALESEVNILLSHRELLRCSTVEYSSCGRYLVASGGRNVLISSTETRDCIKTLKFHKAEISAGKFLFSSAKIVSASWDKTIAIWNWESSDVPSVVSRGHCDWVRDIGLSSDGANILSVSNDCKLKVWQETGDAATDSFSFIAKAESVSVHNETAAIGTDHGRLIVLHWMFRDVIFEGIHEGTVRAVTRSPNGKYLAFGTQDAMVRILSTSTWTPTVEPLKGHGYPVQSIAFSPDSKRVISGAHDGKIFLWNVPNGECLGLVRVFHRRVDSISFSPDGEHILSGSKDGVLRTWNVNSIVDTCHGKDSQAQVEVPSFALSGNGRCVLILTL